MSAALLAAATRALTDELGRAPDLSPGDLAALAGAATDAPQLKRWLKRRLMGEPLPYILGRLDFRGRGYAIDARAYITDPECTHLVDAVVAAIDRVQARTGRPPLVAEVGAGCGSLAISVQLERPAATVVSLELDAAALALARSNAAALGAPVRFVESDLFDAWPGPAAPDLVFADPPWGTEQTLYDAERDAAYYRAMPAASAFPLGGATGLHEQILQAAARLGWASHLILNGGVLPPATLAHVARGARWHEIVSPVPGLSLLHGRMH